MSGILVYQGPSLIDGSPIAVILTDTSKNIKTGRMIQSWIIRTDVEPHVAKRDGRDAAICGDCIHRTLGSCYVRVHNAPLSVYRAFHRGNYAYADDDALQAFLGGRSLRIGSYGDPAAVPTDVWSRAVAYAADNTGYTHAWRYCDADLLRYVQASVDTPDEYADARACGYRTFRTRLESDPLLPGEFVCPAAAERGHATTCEACTACDGTQRGSKKGSPTIIAHGATASRYVKFRMSIS